MYRYVLCMLYKLCVNVGMYSTCVYECTAIINHYIEGLILPKKVCMYMSACTCIHVLCFVLYIVLMQVNI